MIRKMVMASSLGRAATSIKDLIKTTRDKALERCSGSMALFIEVIGRKAFKMV
jgi:hypothetical protein